MAYLELSEQSSQSQLLDLGIFAVVGDGLEVIRLTLVDAGFVELDSSFALTVGLSSFCS